MENVPDVVRGHVDDTLKAFQKKDPVNFALTALRVNFEDAQESKFVMNPSQVYSLAVAAHKAVTLLVAENHKRQAAIGELEQLNNDLFFALPESVVKGRA